MVRGITGGWDLPTEQRNGEEVHKAVHWRGGAKVSAVKQELTFRKWWRLTAWDSHLEQGDVQ